MPLDRVQANADIVSALSGVSISDTQSEISKLESTQTVAPQPTITDRSRDRPLTEFTIFGRFPKELRLKVWDVLLQQFRLIEIEGKQVARNIKRGHNTHYTWDEMQWEDGDGPDHQKFRVAYHSRDPPVILHICRESRRQGLGVYRLMQASLFDTQRICYNPKLDIIYFGQNACRRSTSFSDRALPRLGWPST
jgi:hypothetical protein